jgi:hypothetical protein
MRRLVTASALATAAAFAATALAVPALAGSSTSTTSGQGTASVTASPSPATAMDALATPLLTRPELVAPKTVYLTPAKPVLNLGTTGDWIVKVAPGTVFTSGAAIVGGKNVVLENATIRYSAPAGAAAGWKARGLFLKSQVGVMYVDGLHLTGPLNDGIQMDQKAPGVAVVLKRVAIDLVAGSEAGHHADLLQTWAGPARLVVDGFRGTSSYQGMFLKPNQLWADGPRPSYFWLRDVELDVSTGNYALWTDGFGAFPVQTRDVVVKARSLTRDAWLWPKPSTGDLTWIDVVATL